MAGALLRAALVASCLRGAFPPVDFRAVCFVRAMTSEDNNEIELFSQPLSLIFGAPVCDWLLISRLLLADCP